MVLLIPVMRGKTVAAVASVDPQDGWVGQFRWTLQSSGYAIRATRRGGVCVTRYMHREVCGLRAGDRLEADHINHNRLDNRRTNLRVVSHAENMRNRRPVNQALTQGFTTKEGV